MIILKNDFKMLLRKQVDEQFIKKKIYLWLKIGFF